MNEARRILDLLAQGKISADEAEQLLNAIGGGPGEAAPRQPKPEGRPPKTHLRVMVLKAADERHPEREVCVRVPLVLVRGGMRLGALIPGCGDAIVDGLRAGGVAVDPSKLEPAQLESLLEGMGELTLDIDEGKARVRVTCE